MNKKEHKVLTCQDHTVTKEHFELIWDKELDMLVTSPKPKEEILSKYYESELYISHTDASQSLFDKVYQVVKKYTIRKKVKLINSLATEEKSILDIGCGTGDFLEACKKNQWKISGIEPNKRARNLAVKKSEIKIYQDIEQVLKNQTALFDVITMWHVLEHVYDLDAYLKALKKILKPNGTLIIAVPNFKSYDAFYYGKFWAAYDVPRHLWHFSQKSISLLFKKINFELVKTLPMKFDAYYVSLLSEKYRSSKNNPLKAFSKGWLSNWRAKQSGEYSSLIYLLKNSK